jgi:hypothetical protein
MSTNLDLTRRGRGLAPSWSLSRCSPRPAAAAIRATSAWPATDHRPPGRPPPATRRRPAVSATPGACAPTAYRTSPTQRQPKVPPGRPAAARSQRLPVPGGRASLPAPAPDDRLTRTAHPPVPVVRRLSREPGTTAPDHRTTLGRVLALPAAASGGSISPVVAGIGSSRPSEQSSSSSSSSDILLAFSVRMRSHGGRQRSDRNRARPTFPRSDRARSVWGQRRSALAGRQRLSASAFPPSGRLVSRSEIPGYCVAAELR